VSARGIVRPARRPPWWTASGPRPAGPGERDDLWPGENEDLCHLSGDWRIFQRVDGHRWSLDDLVTAWYAVEAADALDVTHHLDLGCGIGSVLLMVAWSLTDVQHVGIEAQTVSVGLARRSIAYDGIDARARVVHADLREPGALPELRRFELVTGTPPYFDVRDGSLSPNVQRVPCRFETRGGIEDYATAAARWMAPAGRFVACETSGQIGRVRDACEQAGLRLLHWRDVIPKAGKPALLTVFAAARNDDCAAEPDGERAPLTVRDQHDARTPAFVAVRARMGMPP
jgi:tRNA1(Val) A37 N6-methylase TrmN6